MFSGIGLTVVATVFLFFVYFFDWIIYGRSQFTLVGAENKTKCKSRPLPIDEATRCGAQDLNLRVKIKLDDSYFVVDTPHPSVDARCRSLCLEPHNLVAEITDSKKITRSIQLGGCKVLLERPLKQSSNNSNNRLVYFCKIMKGLSIQLVNSQVDKFYCSSLLKESINLP